MRRAVLIQLSYATIIILVLLIPRLAEAAEQTLLLAVQVNGYTLDRIGEFVLRDGALLARRNELDALGFRVPDLGGSGPAALIPLSDLPEFTWRLDQPSQTLFVTVAPDRLVPVVLKAGRTPVGNVKVESGTGATFNYDVVGTSAAGKNVGSSQLDLRVFSPWGVASSDMLAMLAADRAVPTPKRACGWIQPIRYQTQIR